MESLIQQSQTTCIKISIVGAGISALATAFFIEKFAKLDNISVEISIFEASSRLGGKIQSEQCGDFLVEYGADSVATRQPAVHELLNELGLKSEIIAPNERRFSILRAGQLQQVSLSLLAPFPRNISGLFSSKLISNKGKLRACIGGVIAYLGLDKLSTSRSDQSLTSFFRRKWGLEVSSVLLEPLFSGLYGGDLNKISSRVIKVASVKRKHALSPYIGFKRGISFLIETLAVNLSSSKIKLSQRVLSISKSGDALKIKSANNEEIFNICILSTPAENAAAILSEALPGASRILNDFEASDAAIVSLGYAKYHCNADLLQLAGSGIIIPNSESEVIRGITLSSRKWEGRATNGKLLVRVFGREGVFENLGKDKAIELARQQLEQFLELRGEPIYSDLHCWRKGSALCSVGHHNKIALLEQELQAIPGLFVVGAAYGGVGIGDCIESARQIAQTIIRSLASACKSSIQNCR